MRALTNTDSGVSNVDYGSADDIVKSVKDDSICIGSNPHLEIGQDSEVIIGKLAEHIQDLGDDLKIHLDISDHHNIGILGKTGGGKSTITADIIEGVVLSNLDIAPIVVDPTGAYCTMNQPNDSLKDTDILREEYELSPQAIPIRLYKPCYGNMDVDKIPRNKFTISIPQMVAEDYIRLWDFPVHSQTAELIRFVLRQIKSGFVQENRKYIQGKFIYDFADIKHCLTTCRGISDKRFGFHTNTIKAICNRLDTLASSGLFMAKGTNLSSLMKAKACTVIDVSHPNIDDNIRSIIVSYLARMVLHQRSEAVQKKTEPASQCWLILDEAHLYLNNDKSRKNTDSEIINFAKTGRSLGASLVLVTQQPTDIPKEISSQLDTVITFRLTNSADIQQLKKIMPAYTPKVLQSEEFYRSLGDRVALIGNQRLQKRPILVQCRPRLSKHNADTPVPMEISASDTDPLYKNEAPICMPEDELNNSGFLEDVEVVDHDRFLENVSQTTLADKNRSEEETGNMESKLEERNLSKGSKSRKLQVVLTVLLGIMTAVIVDSKVDYFQSLSDTLGKKLASQLSDDKMDTTSIPDDLTDQTTEEVTPPTKDSNSFTNSESNDNQPERIVDQSHGAVSPDQVVQSGEKFGDNSNKGTLSTYMMVLEMLGGK